jgi:hypothetical protein
MKHLLLIALASLMLGGPAVAADPDVLFEDSFDEKLGEGWSWIREDKDAWRIKEKALEIRCQVGHAQTVKNALVRNSPDRSKGKFAVEVAVTFLSDPTQQYEQGGITLYHKKAPVFKLVHERIDGELWIIPGRKPAPQKTLQLRLIVDGAQWTAQFREDPKAEYQTAGTGELPPPDGDDQISIQCYNGPADAEHWMRFDDFRIVKLAD